MALQVILDEGKEVLTFVPIEGFGSNRDDQAALCCPWESAPHVQEVLLVTDTLHEPRQVTSPIQLQIGSDQMACSGYADVSRKNLVITDILREPRQVTSPSHPQLRMCSDLMAGRGYADVSVESCWSLTPCMSPGKLTSPSQLQLWTFCNGMQRACRCAHKHKKNWTTNICKSGVRVTGAL